MVISVWYFFAQKCQVEIRKGPLLLTGKAMNHHLSPAIALHESLPALHFLTLLVFFFCVLTNQLHCGKESMLISTVGEEKQQHVSLCAKGHQQCAPPI